MKRIIPSIIIKDRLAYISIGFNQLVYVGDPLNIVSVLCELGSPEISIIDVTASARNHIDLHLISQIRLTAECPILYSGGIRTPEDVSAVFSAGYDKIVLSASNPNLNNLSVFAAARYGTQAVALSIDYTYNNGLPVIFSPYSRAETQIALLSVLSTIDTSTLSDIIVTNVSQTGSLKGLDLNPMLLQPFSSFSNPIILSGGACSDSLLRISNFKLFDLAGFTVSAAIFLQSHSPNSALVCHPRFFSL